MKDAVSTRPHTFVPGLFIYMAMFPNPAIATIGASAGITLGTAFSVLVIGMSWRQVAGSVQLRIALAILSVAGASTFINILLLGTDSVRGTNVLLALTFALLPLVACGAFPVLNPVSIAVGLGAAIFTHAIVAVAQIRGFSQGRLALVSLYNNPDFADIAAIADVYGGYVRRPFGLFPEPSAAAYGVGTAVILIIALSKLPLAASRLRLLAIGIGIAFVIATASVYAFIFVVLLVLMAARMLARRPFHAVVLTATVAIAGSVAISQFPRLTVGGNASTDYRLESILDGFGIFTGSARQLFVGSGAGSSSAAMEAISSEATAIHSVIVTQLVEYGLPALVLWLTILVVIVKRGGYLLAGAWAAGPLLVTGYTSLGPLWLLLGIILGRKEVSNENPTRNSHTTVGWGRGDHVSRRS